MARESDKKILEEAVKGIKSIEDYDDFLKDCKKRNISPEDLIRMWAKDVLIGERARELYGRPREKSTLPGLKFRTRLLEGNGKALLNDKALDRIMAGQSASSGAVRKEQKMVKTRAAGRVSRMRTLR
jgi:hypothetical protein